MRGQTWCFPFRRGGIPEKNAEWQRQLLYDDPGLVVEELNLIEKKTHLKFKFKVSKKLSTVLEF